MRPTDDGVRSLRFIAEEIAVEFDAEPALEKKPGLPAAFVWRGKRYTVIRLLAEWHDYTRRGRMASNMRPEHAERARLRGSRGVGRDYYRVVTGAGRAFEIYYDRAPRSATDAKGSWHLFREIAVQEDPAPESGE
ncbi:MAG: hypothetical protein GF405_03320 [Candidatus Eisenbacteria bacterium]|nr:hypothetical protein [Candidatus Eisenbacteria bacterium]